MNFLSDVLLYIPVPIIYFPSSFRQNKKFTILLHISFMLHDIYIIIDRQDLQGLYKRYQLD